MLKQFLSKANCDHIRLHHLFGVVMFLIQIHSLSFEEFWPLFKSSKYTPQSTMGVSKKNQ